MANRTHILILILLCCCFKIAAAQNTDYKQVDSLSYAQYQSGQWQTLIDYANKSLSAGVDYPLLRLRMAYAQLSIGNYSGALAQYQQVLKHDSHNPTARYFSMLCNQYLGRSNEASYQAAFIDSATLNLQHIKRFGALEAGLETSVKTSNNSNRGTGSYSRMSFSNRLGWRLQLDQSVAYFTQRISNYIDFVPSASFPASVNVVNTTYPDKQFEYYAKLGYTINNNMTVLGAYHYLGIKYGQSNYSGNIGMIGLKYAAPYFTLQGDINTGEMANSHLTQFNAQIAVYPSGNQNLYLVSRGTVQSDKSQVIFTQTLGFKVAKPLWLQGAASVGRMDNYLEADALYIYNAIDITKFKAGITLFYAVGRHTIIYLNNTVEQKEDYYRQTNYNQNAITGGLTWKF